MDRLALMLALICFLSPPVKAKYVEGQLNDPVQVSVTHLLYYNKQKKNLYLFLCYLFNI